MHRTAAGLQRNGGKVSSSYGAIVKLVVVLLVVALFAGCSSESDGVETVATLSVEALPTTTAEPADAAEVPADDFVVLSGLGGNHVYVLEPAALNGDALGALTVADTGSWAVLVEFTPHGSAAFDALAADIFGRQLAIVLDGVVLVAPTINATEFGGRATITAGLGEVQTRRLAETLVGTAGDPDRFTFRPVVTSRPIVGADPTEISELVTSLRGQ